jgi:hypothetical protein
LTNDITVDDTDEGELAIGSEKRLNISESVTLNSKKNAGKGTINTECDERSLDVAEKSDQNGAISPEVVENELDSINKTFDGVNYVENSISENNSNDLLNSTGALAQLANSLEKKEEEKSDKAAEINELKYLKCSNLIDF